MMKKYSIVVEAERSLATAQERERVSREECSGLLARLADLDALLHTTREDLNALSEREHQHLLTIERLETDLKR